MALDNAQFISQLSITDPPGTDAVAEGDDHIRTTKRATQQSFPNVDAAVPQTAAQMGQMAIKNEVNVFTQTNSFTIKQDFVDRNKLSASATNFPGFRYHDLSDDLHWEVYADIRTDQGWAMDRYEPPGVFLDTPLKINRISGSMTLTKDPIFENTTHRIRALADLAVGINFQLGTNNAWALSLRNVSEGNNFQLRRFNVSGGILDIPLEVAFSDGSLTIKTTSINHANLLKVHNDNFHLRRSATPSPTARVGHSLRREDNTKMWEIYADNNDDFHMNQRRSVAGAASGTSIKILFASGHIVMAQLPTSAPATSKTLWMSSGFVAITP